MRNAQPCRRGTCGTSFSPDVEQGAQRQADGAPERVADDPGQGDPDVAVEELLVGRPRGGVVVDAGPLDVRAVALGRGVVQRRTAAARPGRGRPGRGGAAGGEPVGVAAQGGEEVVVGGEAGADAGGAEPAGDGAAALGEEGAEEQDGEAPGEALVEAGGQAGDEVLPKGRQEGKIHGRLSGLGSGPCSNPYLGPRALRHARKSLSRSALAIIRFSQKVQTSIEGNRIEPKPCVIRPTLLIHLSGIMTASLVVLVTCSPKTGPGGMRVSEALRGQETNHEATHGRGGHPQAAPGRGRPGPGPEHRPGLPALGVSEQTLHRWRNQYGGLKADEAKRLKELEAENARLKRLVAELALDKQMLQEVAQKKW